MPPLARNLIDSTYIGVLVQWIDSLTPVVTTTIGNTNDGTQTDNLWSNGAWINASRFQAAGDLTVTTMVAKVTAISGRYKCAVYSDNGGMPNQLLRSTVEIVGPGNGWQSFALSSALALTNGQFYWLAIWSDDANAQIHYSGNNGALRWGRYNYGNWPNPVATTDGNNLNYSIYAFGSVAPTLTSITVTPANVTIAGGTTQQFTATGTYADASTQNFTSQATWTSSNAVVATVNASGLATGGSVGTTTIAASLNGVTGITPLTVGKSNAVVNLSNLSQMYDGTARPVTATTMPAALPVAITYAGGEEAPTNVGNYQVIGAVNHPNYAGGATNTLAVAAHPLSVIASNASRVYGEANPVFGGTLTGVQSGDSISATYSAGATTESPVGVYEIVPALVDPGNKQSNYSVTLINGVLTIVQPPRLLSLAKSPEGMFTSTWQVSPGRRYEFQSKANLTDANWTTTTNLTPQAGEFSVTIFDEMGTNHHRFYRLRDVTLP